MAVIILYFSLFLGVHLLAKLFKNPAAARWFQLAACFALLFAFFGFRDITILNDTSHYYGFYFQKAHILSYKQESVFVFHLTDKFEYGFQVLVHLLVKYVSTEPYTIILVSSFVITVGELWFIDKYYKDIAKVCFYMLVAGLFFMHYCIIRQAIAIMLFYVAFGYLVRRQYLKYCLLIVGAGLFHMSALFLLILPVVQNANPSRKNTLIALAIAVVLALSVFEILSILGLREHPYYKAAVQKDSLSLVGLADLAFMGFTLFACWYARQKARMTTPDRLYYWICVLALCVCLVAPVLYPVARINEYLWPFIILHMLRYIDPQAVKQSFVSTEDGVSGFLRIVVVAVFLAKMIGVNTFRPEWLHIEPYQFYDFEKAVHTYNIYPQQ